MSEFGKVLEESEKRQNSPKARFSSDFLKLTSDHSTTIRVLDEKPESSLQHFVPKRHHAFPNTNNGKGMSFMCPGRDKGCPLCEWNDKQRAKDPDTSDLLKPRRVYTFNVLDRTPVVVCPVCGVEYYATNNTYPEECECGQDITGIDPTPRNKIVIMQKGKRIIDQFKSFEAEPELGNLCEYDIKIDTRGKGSDTMTTCVPKQKTKIDMEEAVGKDWRDSLFNIKELVKPLDPELTKRILNGEDYYSVVSSNKSNE